MKTIRPYINPEKRNHGFTLIELLVVIVILAILMAIAIPAYLSQQKKAKDSAAKQYLTVAWKSARTAAVDNSGNYPTTAASLVSTIQASEPELSVVAGSKSDVSATNDKKVVIDTSSLSGSSITLYVESASGTIWSLTASNTSSPDYEAVAAATDQDLVAAMLGKGAVAAGDYFGTNGTYVAMTTAALKSYDGTIDDALNVESGTFAAYCLNYTLNATTESIDQTGARHASLDCTGPTLP